MKDKKIQIDNKTTIIFKLWHFISLIVTISVFITGGLFGYYKIVVKTSIDNTEQHYQTLYAEQKKDIRDLNNKMDNLSNAINNVSNNLNLLNQKINIQKQIHQPGTISLGDDTARFSGKIVER